MDSTAVTKIKQAAAGRWPEILSALSGFDPPSDNGKVGDRATIEKALDGDSAINDQTRDGDF